MPLCGGVRELPKLATLYLAWNNHIADEDIVGLTNLSDLNYNQKVTDTGIMALVNVTALRVKVAVLFLLRPFEL
jgi:hypothetical protein